MSNGSRLKSDNMWFFLSLLSAVFYAAYWVVLRASNGIPSSLVTVAGFISGPVLLAYSWPNAVIPWSHPLWWVFLFWMIILNPFFSWTFTFASQRTPLSIAKPLSSLTSISAMFTGVLAFDQNLPSIGILGILVGVAGLFLLYHGRWEAWRKPHPWMVLLCVLSFGINTSITAEALKICPNPLLLIGIGWTPTFLVCLLGMVSKKSWQRLSQRQWTLLAVLTSVMIVQEIASVNALFFAPAPYVVTVKRFSILLTSIIGYFWFKERDIPLPRLVLAVCIVIAGAVMLVL